MHIESVRAHCMSLPHVTEQVQWENHLLFKVGGKMFGVVSLEPDRYVLSLKVSDENFVQLQETEGIVPAPYLARAKWLAFERFDLLRDSEFQDLLTEAHQLVFDKLPRKTREQLSGTTSKRESISKKSARPGTSKSPTKRSTKKTSKSASS